MNEHFISLSSQLVGLKDERHARAHIEKSHLALGSFGLLILIEDGSVDADGVVSMRH
jgi:hypothetical protein